MRTTLGLLALTAGLLQAQQPTTTIPGGNLSGQTVTIPVQITSPLGASAVLGFGLYVKTDPAGPHSFYLYVDLASTYLQIYNGGTGMMWPYPQLNHGTHTVDWGVEGQFKVTGYTFTNPALTGNTLQMSFTVKRWDTGLRHLTIAAAQSGPESDRYSLPGSSVSAAQWNYTTASGSSWTVAPTALNRPASSYLTPIVIANGTPAATPQVTIAPTTANWLRVQGPVTLTGFNLALDPNLTGAARSATLSVSDGAGAPRTVTVTQAAAVNERPVSSILAPVDLSGQTVTVPIRVNTANGAPALSDVTLFAYQDPSLAGAWSSVYLNLATRKVQVYHGGTHTMWPLPDLLPGTVTLSPPWGAPGLLEVVGYRFVDPNTSGNTLELDLTLKRYAPLTNTLHLKVDTYDAVSSEHYGLPPTALGTWSFGAASDFTISGPNTTTLPSNQTGFVDLTFTPTGSPGTITPSTTEPGVTFNPTSADLNTGQKIIRINLPARTTAYNFNITAGTKTHNLQVQITQPSITLSAGTPTAVYAGQLATVPLTITANGWTGNVQLSCLSAAPGLYCPNTNPVNITQATTIQVATDPATPTGSAVTIIATPTGPGAPPAVSAVTTLTLTRGFTLTTVNPPNSLFQNVPATLDVMLVPSGGFTGTVAFNCTLITCTGSATVTGAQALPVRLSLKGTSPSTPAPVTLSASGNSANNQTTFTTDVKPTQIGTILDPASGNTLPQPASLDANQITFRWSPGINTTSHRLRITDGSANPVFDGTTTNTFSQPINVAPFCAPGSPSCPSYSIGVNWTARVTYYNGLTEIGTAQATYTIGNPLTPPTGFGPPEGTNLCTGGPCSYTFSWTQPNSVAGYRLRVGTQGYGSGNIYEQFFTPGGVPSANYQITVPNIPAAPIPVYVTLETSYPNVQGLYYPISRTYNTMPINGTTGGSSGIPGNVTLSLGLPTTGTILASPGRSRVAATVSTSGSYAGPLTIGCSGPGGVTCAPVTVPSASGQQQVPLVVNAPASAALTSGTLTVVAMAQPDGAVKATAGAPLTVIGVPADGGFLGIGLTTGGVDISYVVNDGRSAYASWIREDSPGNLPVERCTAAVPNVTIEIAQQSPTDLQLRFSADGTSPGDYSFTCQFRESTQGVFLNPQILRVVAAPTITSIEPSEGEQGTDVPVIVRGTFPSSQPVTLRIDGGPGVSVLSGTSPDDSVSQIRRTIRISPDAPAGARTVYLETRHPSVPQSLWAAAQVPQGQSGRKAFQVLRPVQGVRIFRDSTDVSWRDTTVRSGEGVSLRLVAPAGQTFSYVQWRIPPQRHQEAIPDPVANWQVAGLNSERAVLTKLLDSDLRNEAVRFYWVGGHSLLFVECDFRLSSAAAGSPPVSVGSWFTVDRPQITSLNSNRGRVYVDNQHPMHSGQPWGYLSNKPNGPGMLFWYFASPTAQGNQFAFVQLVQTDETFRVTNPFLGSPEEDWTYLAPNGQFPPPPQLDDEFPYGAETFTSSGQTNDTPGIGMSGLATRKATSYSMWLMAKPLKKWNSEMPIADSIYVPLRRVDWEIGVTGCRTSGQWAKSGKVLHGEPSPVNLGNTLQFPVWTSRALTDLLIWAPANEPNLATARYPFARSTSICP